jgi:hypothetical protein
MLALLTLALAAAPVPASQKLVGVEKGLSDILKHSAALEDIVQPMVNEVHAAIASKKEADCEKVLSKFPEWRKEMTKRQTDLTESGDSQRTALLVSVLQNRMGESVAAQMDVVKSADFAGLPVVDFVVKHSDGETPLVSLCLKFLDEGEAAQQADQNATVPVRKAEEPELPKDASLAAIIAQLEKHEERAEHTVEMLKTREQKLKAVFEENNKKQKAGTGLNTAAGKFLEKKEVRKLDKRLATEETTEKALKTAIEDIKHKDIKGLTEAKNALQASMAAMVNEAQSQQGDFLHFLQTDAERQPTGSFACPYCGAQCVEKCRNNEHKSYSACLTECIALNPVEKK